MGNISIKDNELVALLPEHLRESNELKSAEKLILGDLLFLYGLDFAKENGFVFKPHALEGRKAPQTILTGYTAILDDLIRKGITNSSVCLERLQFVGFPGGLTTVKDYIASHKHLIPAKCQLVVPQGSRGRRFTTEPGEAYQMDWGFTKVWTMTAVN